jgi:hypothetical protein
VDLLFFYTFSIFSYLIKEIIMVEKSFFRIRVKETYPYPAVMVKGLGKVTKTWQLKKGEASDYTEYPNLDVQPMVKEGNTFVLAQNTASADESESSGTGGSSGSGPAPEPEEDETAAAQNEKSPENTMPDFTEMTVEQLKSYLTDSGVSAGNLRGAVKADLITQAEAVWNTQHQSQEQPQD